MPKLTFSALKAANRLPSPPAVAMRILQLVADEETTLEELAQVISADPALTAKILKYLHSPLIGLGFHGTTLVEAIARIGTRGAQLLALSFSLVSQRHFESCPSFQFGRFWSESLARAVAARRLAAVSRDWEPEEAFVVGLVLRLGQLVLATGVPADYEPVLAAGAGAAADLAAREQAALGMSHLEVGLSLLKDWKLPESIWGAVEPFVGPETSAGPRPTTQILRLADAVALFLAREKERRGDSLEALTATARETVGLEPAGFRALLDQISRDWVAYGELLAIPTGEPPDLDALEQEAEEHRTALRLAAELEVMSLRNENQQLSHLANRDRLTGLLNRGAFDGALAAGVAAAQKDHRPLALVMADIDRFKLVNDRHGHPAGDGVLRHVARIFHTYTKAPAEAYRYGGEEFALVVPGASLDDALAMAETLRLAIAHSPHLEGTTTIPLTVSLGVAWAQWPARPRTASELLAAADRCLYEAKHAGRNTVRPAVARG